MRFPTRILPNHCATDKVGPVRPVAGSAPPFRRCGDSVEAACIDARRRVQIMAIRQTGAAAGATRGSFDRTRSAQCEAFPPLIVRVISELMFLRTRSAPISGTVIDVYPIPGVAAVHQHDRAPTAEQWTRQGSSTRCDSPFSPVSPVWLFKAVGEHRVDNRDDGDIIEVDVRRTERGGGIRLEAQGVAVSTRIDRDIDRSKRIAGVARSRRRW
jgi:hypothetical protein